MSKKIQKIRKIHLPVDWSASDRGNTVLETGEGNMVAWLTMPGDPGTGKGPKLADNPWFRLQVSYCPDNHPALNVSVVALSDTQLANHINRMCQGWIVRRCNIAGVNMDEHQRVREDGDTAEEDQDLSDPDNEVRHAAMHRLWNEGLRCLECQQSIGEDHDPGCGKRVVGCPTVVADDCVDEDDEDEDTAEDEAEEQRRDEKHGLYPQHEDPAN